MKRFLAGILAVAAWGATARAHFVMIVPQAGGSQARIVLSENLAPDENVPIDKVAAGKFSVRSAAGTDALLLAETEAHSLLATVPGSGLRVLHGTVVYGVMARGDAKPYLLQYHPKAIVGNPFAAKPLGEPFAIEAAVAGVPGKLQIQILARGKPLAGVEVNFTQGGPKEKLKTDAEGKTPVIAATGRIGLWAKTSEAASGELDGKKYEEIRHYATLVVDVPPPAFPPLPQAVSSLGAAASDGYLYIYGGHAGKTHTYDTKTVLGTFHRLKLDGGRTWEELPGGPLLQGVNLAAYKGVIYRVGGMSPRNAPGEPTDNLSLPDAARFDPKVGKWEALPPMPSGRSSHDVVVAGDKLVVVGGWQSRGRGVPSVWQDTALILDLASGNPQWKAIPQPFQRRALTAAAVGSKVYVIGGLDKDAKAHNTVNILDVTTGEWANGPDLPGDHVGFSPAAGTVAGRVVVNTSEGPVYRLNQAGTAWDAVGKAETTRIVHRLVPHGANAILVGGAGQGGNVAVVESVELKTSK